ncbi:MAG: hypothetical protein M0C28_27200 [Candidatus Moduliflexus flocculans]|nr:hypothetical protein [Candidatus Moduliflexus flocculans]
MIMFAYYVITAFLLFLAGMEPRPREGTPPGRRPLPSRHDPPRSSGSCGGSERRAMKKDTLFKAALSGAALGLVALGRPAAPPSPAFRGPRRQGPGRDGGPPAQRVLAEARGHGRATLTSSSSKGRSPGARP